MAMTITAPTLGLGCRLWNCRNECHVGKTSHRLFFPACGMDPNCNVASVQLFGVTRKLNVVHAVNQEASRSNLHLGRYHMYHLESQPCAWKFLSGFSSIASFVDIAHASEETPLNAIYEVSELLEFGVQLLYLGGLLGVLGVGSFFVVRQILIRRELEKAAKELQERVRSGEASAMEYFELGAVMLRKKFYPLATKYLEQAIQKWDGDVQDLAQVHNALGFSYVSDGKLNKAASEFEKAVKLQPGYATAWNNIGDVYEKKKDLEAALKAYEQALLFDPHNKIARSRRDAIKERVDLFKGIPSKSER